MTYEETQQRAFDEDLQRVADVFASIMDELEPQHKWVGVVRSDDETEVDNED